MQLISLIVEHEACAAAATFLLQKTAENAIKTRLVAFELPTGPGLFRNFPEPFTVGGRLPPALCWAFYFFVRHQLDGKRKRLTIKSALGTGSHDHASGPSLLHENSQKTSGVETWRVFQNIPKWLRISLV